MILYCPDSYWTEDGQQHKVYPGSAKTVGAFVRAVMHERRWEQGMIHIRRSNEAERNQDTTPPLITYCKGQIMHSRDISEYLLNREIVSVTANDTWTHMDYMVICK